MSFRTIATIRCDSTLFVAQYRDINILNQSQIVFERLIKAHYVKTFVHSLNMIKNTALSGSILDTIYDSRPYS